MVKKKPSLGERYNGYQFAQIERALIFDRQDTGFVRPIEGQPWLFYLDPSPFLPTPREEIYVAPYGSPPAAGDLVEVTVENEKPDTINGKLYNVKIINSWKCIDPTTIIPSRKLIDPYELLWFFMAPYKGEIDDLKSIALCSALSCLSAPPLMSNMGGINTAVFSDKSGWTAYSRTMQIIPMEFRKTSSPYYYKISKEEGAEGLSRNIEVSYAIYLPENTVMHNPLTIDCEAKGTGWYREAQES